MSQKIDIVGHRFGRLVVIADNGGGVITCRCDCGTVKKYNKSNVKQGYTTSCGCSRKHTRPELIKSIIGRRYGKLVVLDELGYGYVLCRCDCGTVKKINKRHLINGDILSCGCLQKESANNNKKAFLVDGTNIARISEIKATVRSKSGIRGVCYRESKGMWRANIGFKGEKIDLGTFGTKKEAIKARKMAEEKYYTPEIKKWSDVKMKKMIYTGDALDRLAEETKGKNRRTSNFSPRLEEIVERWYVMKDLYIPPEFSDVEVGILSEVICGSTIDRRKIRGLQLDILDSVVGNEKERLLLSKKIEAMSPADRIMLCEYFGQ